MTNLTTLETKTLVEGIFNNPFYVESGWAWVDSVAEYAGIEGPEFRGVFTSLKKKGMVELNGNSGRDACVRPTIAACVEAGKEFSTTDRENRSFHPCDVEPHWPADANDAPDPLM